MMPAGLGNLHVSMRIVELLDRGALAIKIGGYSVQNAHFVLGGQSSRDTTSTGGAVTNLVGG
jgi:hypothetical protein